MNIKSKIGLGTVQFGISYGISNDLGKTSEHEVKRILDYATLEGIDLLDTASAYGSSEETLGKVGIGKFKVVTKFMSPRTGLSVKDQVEQSFKRLGTDQFYGLLAHRADSLTENPAIWNYLTELKGSGKIEKIGFSFNTVQEVNEVLSKNYIPDLIQVPYNIFDQRFKPYMIRLKEMGCEIHTRSAFLQGLFFCDPEGLHPFFDSLKPQLKELQNNGSNLPGLLLNFCLQPDYIDKVILGVNNLEQLTANIKSLEEGKSLPEIAFSLDEKFLMPFCWPK